MRRVFLCAPRGIPATLSLDGSYQGVMHRLGLVKNGRPYGSSFWDRRRRYSRASPTVLPPSVVEQSQNQGGTEQGPLCVTASNPQTVHRRKLLCCLI